jgi:TonB family protein
MFQEKGVRGIDAAIAISIVLHVGMLLLTSKAAPRLGEVSDMKEVSFMDVTYRPEVARILPKAALPGGGGSADLGPVPTYASGVAAEDVPAIDLNTSLERDKSSAKINLDRYEMDRGEGMDVIRLGGAGSEKSTEEILAQPKVALSRGLGRAGSGAGIGLRGMPGVPQPTAQLTIEHRALSAPRAKALPTMAPTDLPRVEAPVSRGTNFMVAGPISSRSITKKIVPRYPKWAVERRISGTVVVRIWVEPNGRVKGAPAVETSSGYPDLDQVVVDALRGWEFAPLGPEVKSEDQWGVVTFKFTLS